MGRSDIDIGEDPNNNERHRTRKKPYFHSEKPSEYNTKKLLRSFEKKKRPCTKLKTPVLSGPKLIRTISAVFRLFGRFEFEFVVVEIISKKTIRFFVCSGFIHTQCDCTCACAVTCYHTCVDQVQTHSRQTHTQTTYTAQTQSHFHSNCGCVLDDS